AGEVRSVSLDVRDEDAIAGLLDEIVEAHGRLDCAFNNAGVLLASLEAEWDVGQFQEGMDVNVTGVMRCMKHERRRMEGLGNRAMVNNGSIGGLVGLPGSVAYSASKHAVVGMTKAAALRYASSGVRINAVCPGPTDTPMGDVARARRKDGQPAGAIPMGR